MSKKVRELVLITILYSLFTVSFLICLWCFIALIFEFIDISWLGKNKYDWETYSSMPILLIILATFSPIFIFSSFFLIKKNYLYIPDYAIPKKLISYIVFIFASFILFHETFNIVFDIPFSLLKLLFMGFITLVVAHFYYSIFSNKPSQDSMLVKIVYLLLVLSIPVVITYGIYKVKTAVNPNKLEITGFQVN